MKLFLSLTLLSLYVLVQVTLCVDNAQSEDCKTRINTFKGQLKDRKLGPNSFLRKVKGCWKDLRNDETLFSISLQDFNINCKNTDDRNSKKKVFYQNIERAENLSDDDDEATFGITLATFMDPNEFIQKRLMKPRSVDDPTGGIIDEINEGTKKIIDKVEEEKNKILDKLKEFENDKKTKKAIVSVDLRSQNAVNPIKDQGNCGSCWSFATVATMETSYYQKNRALLNLSEQQFVNCDKQDSGCDGGWMSSAYTYAKGTGIAQNSTNPYIAKEQNCTAPVGTTVKVRSYTQLTAKYPTAIINALNSGYAVAIALQSSTSQFMYYTGGILTNASVCTGNTVDHAVTIIGYNTVNNTNYWIVRNSWGTNWGESGYVRIKRGINYCNMEVYPFIVTIV